MYVHRAGDTGPVVACLHGIGSSGASFAGQVAGLSRDHRVVAWDAPGYANSADPAGPPGLSGYVTAAARLIADLAPVHLVGVSWGGVIGCQLALTHPRLLRSLILIDASRGSGREQAKAAAMRRRGAELAEQGACPLAAQRAPRLLSSAASPALVARVRDNMARSIRLPGYGYAAESMAEADLEARLGEIRVPTLVMCGELDRVTGPVESTAIAAAIPGAAYVPIQGAGHLANQERESLVNAWIRAFVRVTEETENISTSMEGTD